MADKMDTYQDRVSRDALRELLSLKGEGDEWDFKALLWRRHGIPGQSG